MAFLWASVKLNNNQHNRVGSFLLGPEYIHYIWREWGGEGTERGYGRWGKEEEGIVEGMGRGWGSDREGWGEDGEGIGKDGMG